MDGLVGRRIRFGPRLFGIALAVVAVAWATAGSGQEADLERGGIRGSVLDAATGSGVAGANVVLQPDVTGAFPGPVSGSAFATATRTVTTDSAGSYRFDGLPPGVYRLYVTRVSYRPYSVVVELRTGAESAVSIGLAAAPIPLEPIRGSGRTRGPYVAGYAFADDDGLTRLMAADLRRRLYLTTDVRELTHADVVEGVTLGEPDVFRALQRLPGVSTRSDYSAELWTRGAPWSHTRVFYDGVPLFNPLHALGILSGIGSSAVGAVWFHPGVRSSAMGEGAAAVIDVRSRGATGAGELNVRGDLSLMTAGLAMDQRVLDGRAGWMVSARRTYLDWLADLAGRAAGLEESEYPYGFGEVAGRLDARLGRATTVETSWLWEGDYLTNGDVDGAEPLRAEWGNFVGQATLATRLGSLDIRHTVSGSQHHADVLERPDSMSPAFEAVRLLGESTIQFGALTGSISPEPVTMAGPDWTAGYALEHRANSYSGPVPRAVPVAEFADLDTGGLPDSLMTDWTADLAMLALWGDRSWSVGERVALRTGLRAEIGEAPRGSGPFRLAPRLSVRFTPLPEVAFSAGAGRVYQYVQAVAPGGVHLATLTSTDAWQIAGSDVPAIASDMVTAGLEAWLAPGRQAAINAFGRRATGIVVPDPTPGPLEERTRTVEASNTAYGVEVSVRQITGPVTGSAGYTLTRSRMSAAGLEYPSGADRTHVFDATALARVAPAVRIGAAFTAATGVPFTRAISQEDECAAVPGCDPDALPWTGEPHATRAPAFASLDLLVDWSTQIRGVELGVYGQLRNVLGRDNATVYTGTGCIVIGCGMDELRNAYERGVPRLPVIGVRVRH